MSSAISKRFIAGAKCSRCGAFDRTRLCRQDDREWIECIACGFTEERPTAVAGGAAGDSDKAAVKWQPGQPKS